MYCEQGSSGEAAQEEFNVMPRNENSGDVTSKEVSRELLENPGSSIEMLPFTGMHIMVTKDKEI